MKKVILALVLSVCGLFAKPPIMLYIELDKVLDSKDFMEIVGNEVSFSFGSGSKEKVIANAKSRGRAKIDKENVRFTKSLSGKAYQFNEIEVACGFALLENLADLKAQAQRVGGTKVVNIISYYTKTEQRDSTDSFLCYVSKRKVSVKLQADFAK